MTTDTNNLHGAIMNLLCKVHDDFSDNASQRAAYRLGHRDARHAAAELVCAQPLTDEQIEPTAEMIQQGIRAWRREVRETTADDVRAIYMAMRRMERAALASPAVPPVNAGDVHSVGALRAGALPQSVEGSPIAACGEVERATFLADKAPGSPFHLTVLMAPYHLNLVVGHDREQLLAWGRDVWGAALAAAPKHQVALPDGLDAAARDEALQPDQQNPSAAQEQDTRDAALRELVALEDQKARANAISPVEPGCEKEVLMDDYRRRQPAAWAAARAAIDAAMEGTAQ